jgi:DNA-binding GntR family transcriptional regulator
MLSRDLRQLALAPALRKRQRTSEHVADSLREAIRNGELADGTELNQVALAEHFGVSRVPIREAIFRLQAEGWITAEPHHSAVVHTFSPERIAEIFDLRKLLETYLIEKSLDKISTHTLDTLKLKCDEMERISDRQEWLAANAAFHRALYEPSEAITSIALLEQLTSQVERYLRTQGGGNARGRVAIKEHREILAAVVRRDKHEVQRLLRDHIENSLQYVTRAIEENGS